MWPRELYAAIYSCDQIYNYRDISLTTGLYVKYALVNFFDLKCKDGSYPLVIIPKGEAGDDSDISLKPDISSYNSYIRL